MGTSRKNAFAISLALCGLAVGLLAPLTAAGDEATLYVKKDSWPETMLATRQQYRQWFLEMQGRRPIAIGPWFATAPLPASNFSDALFPERGVDLEAKDSHGKPLWRERKVWRDGRVHPLRGGKFASTYLYRTLSTAKPITLTAHLGSDDGIEVWLNGNKLLSKDVPRTAAPDQEHVDLPLGAGENGLLLKIYNRGGTHAFYCAFGVDYVSPLAARAAQDFPEEMTWMARDIPGGDAGNWFTAEPGAGEERAMIAAALRNTGDASEVLRREASAMHDGGTPDTDPRWLDLYTRACVCRQALAALEGQIDFAALRRAIVDLAASFPQTYGSGDKQLEQINLCEQRLPEVRAAVGRGDADAKQQVADLLKAVRAPLLANPLLDFDRLLVVKRQSDKLGLPQNWQGNCALSPKGYHNEIGLLALDAPGRPLTTLFRPEDNGFVGDVDLHFDGQKMLFSMPGSHGRWQIWEIGSDGTGLRQVTPGEHPDVDNYDACYLPDGRIAFDSTRCFQGIPCVGGGNTVANLCLMDDAGQNIRQLCFDQDHDWCPTVLNNGRILFTRWEYSDTPHYFSRLLFHMNPDGTNQAEYYGSNSFWPNSTFYARPIPGHPTQVVAIVSGHHGVPRMGELLLFDPAKGRHEANGVVQRIPGYGKKVEPVIVDQLVNASWPKFLHPYPLSDKYFLVSCKPTPEAPWGIYLVDIFDNMTLLKAVPGYALFEPIPLRKTPRPPVIPDKVRPDQQDAVVYLTDVYIGQGLEGVPRGTVKKLRLYEFHYTYPKMGGHINVGVESAWDVHRILGTVPVYEDGSASFVVPANMPIAVQPLDAEGKAVQLMRSWFTAMPGETLSCVGCHERQSSTPPPRATLASQRPPVPITPWYGPPRGFSFKREVQPVLDRHCVKCHNDAPRVDAKKIPDFTAKDKNGWGNFTPSYLALHPYVRRPGPESDYRILPPLEYHADTSELVQMLQKGHKGVRLDRESWDRLVTWIDLNVPDHGTWGEHRPIPANFHERRIEMRTRYANRPEDPEVIPEVTPFADGAATPASDKSEQPLIQQAVATEMPAAWPFDAQSAAQLQQKAGPAVSEHIDLGDGVEMDLTLIPAGAFVMGAAAGPPDLRPQRPVRVDAPFWMGVTEVTNRQFRQFDPTHDSGFLDQHHKDHTRPGYAVSDPDLPVIRITWEQAMAFCAWLSQQTGRHFTLPTEAQWEWACRAGTATASYFGDRDSDFSTQANLADSSMRLLAVTGVDPQPIKNPNPYQDFLPKDARYDDGEKLMATVGRYLPNPWGLQDMHGNVAEWTLSLYRPYPYQADDGRNDVAAHGKRVVRGGSWKDRPKRASSAFRLPYQPWQPVFNVGFRVVCAQGTGQATLQTE